MSEDFGSLKGGGDCQDHYHNSDRYPTRDSLLWLQSLEHVKTITTNYTVSPSDDIIVINGVSLGVTLPSAQNGRHCIFVVNSGSATLTPYGSETINGAASLVINTAIDAAYLKAVSGGWVNLVPSVNANVFPFYRADGTFDSIGLVSGALPFYDTAGTLKLITLAV